MSCSPSPQSCAASLPCAISMFGGTSSAPCLMVRKMKNWVAGGEGWGCVPTANPEGCRGAHWNQKGPVWGQKGARQTGQAVTTECVEEILLKLKEPPAQKEEGMAV